MLVPEVAHRGNAELEKGLEGGLPQKGDPAFQILEGQHNPLHQWLTVGGPGCRDAIHQPLPNVQNQGQDREQD